MVVVVEVAAVQLVSCCATGWEQFRSRWTSPFASLYIHWQLTKELVEQLLLNVWRSVGKTGLPVLALFVAKTWELDVLGAELEGLSASVASSALELEIQARISCSRLARTSSLSMVSSLQAHSSCDVAVCELGMVVVVVEIMGPLTGGFRCISLTDTNIGLTPS